MSIVTKTGDTGTTGLFGKGRVAKDTTRIHAYGTVDELNALLGVIIAEDVSTKLRQSLMRLQHALFRVGADLATPLSSTSAMVKRVRPEDTQTLEVWINELESSLPPLACFILPGGSRAGALLHQARTVCRRSERWVVTLGKEESLNPEILRYLNRLGDYLFLTSREENRRNKTKETPVHYDP